jgi:hypothetical protein
MTPHYKYTTVLNKEGWELIVHFVEKNEDEFEDRPDDWITEQELRPYHEAIRYITEVFGLPKVGDVINCPQELITIVERWFDFEKKQVTLFVE